MKTCNTLPVTEDGSTDRLSESMSSLKVNDDDDDVNGDVGGDVDDVDVVEGDGKVAPKEGVALLDNNNGDGDTMDVEVEEDAATTNMKAIKTEAMKTDLGASTFR